RLGLAITSGGKAWSELAATALLQLLAADAVQLYAGEQLPQRRLLLGGDLGGVLGPPLAEVLRLLVALLARREGGQAQRLDKFQQALRHRVRREQRRRQRRPRLRLQSVAAHLRRLLVGEGADGRATLAQVARAL